MTPGPSRRRGPRRGPATVAAGVLAAVVLEAALAGCGPAHGVPAARSTTAGAVGSTPAAAARTPSSPGELGGLVLTQVPSGLPRMPDDELRPRAGEKSLDDVAGYASNPAHERQVLRRYGFRWGWERFWGRGSVETSVFVEQFTAPPGAGSFAADLATNEAGHYGAVLHENPPGLPAGCRLLEVDRPAPGVGLAGPTVMAWCARGPFSVAVSAASTSVDAATAEVAAAARAQLARLPA